jgi:outer membrane protein OmpA-like peptidoglycan-associated protein
LQLRHESAVPSRLSGEAQAAKVEQVDFGNQARFETCIGDGCSRPTRKTLPGDGASVQTSWAQPAPGAGADVAAVPQRDEQVAVSRPIASAAAQDVDGWRMTIALPAGAGARAEAAASRTPPSRVSGATMQAALKFVADDSSARDVKSQRAASEKGVESASGNSGVGAAGETQETRLIVNFAFAGVHLTAPAKSAIRDAIPLVRKAHRVVIAGRTDSVGDSNVNQAIALARAIHVRDYIKEVAPEAAGTIAIDARGNCCFVASNSTHEGRFKNRRVEIVMRGKADAS